ncbi:MAG: nucleotidyltransferase domain-containing protein [Clostridia bacterium]|jgi:predicted nucleotidyltransferase|nr:nucleotidyltransferase domain-containing protein [Clostridia bacterium]
MSEKVYTIDEIRKIAAPIAARHGVSALYLFGSYARGEATPASDLDFRIEKGKIRSLFQLTGFEMDLEHGFDKPLDVLTTSMLSEQFLRSIQPEEVLIYAEN